MGEHQMWELYGPFLTVMEEYARRTGGSLHYWNTLAHNGGEGFKMMWLNTQGRTCSLNLNSYSDSRFVLNATVWGVHDWLGRQHWDVQIDQMELTAEAFMAEVFTWTEIQVTSEKQSVPQDITGAITDTK